MKSNKNLLGGLSTLKETIIDRNTGRECSLCKAWNMILREYNGNNMNALLDRAEKRFVMEMYQFDIICNLARVLEIIEKGENHV